MMYSEFYERTKTEISYEEYHYVEESYYEFDGNKDEFCKAWLKDVKSGKWALELRLRKALDDQKAEYEEKLAEKEENIKFYRPYFDRAMISENILLASGKEKVEVFNIKIKGEQTWRKHKNVKVRYIDNGFVRFINVLEDGAWEGWATSIKISDIESVEVR